MGIEHVVQWKERKEERKRRDAEGKRWESVPATPSKTSNALLIVDQYLIPRFVFALYQVLQTRSHYTTNTTAFCKAQMIPLICRNYSYYHNIEKPAALN